MMWSFQGPDHLGLPIERKAHWAFLGLCHLLQNPT